MILPESKVKNRNFDYLEGFSQGLLIARQMVKGYFTEPYDIIQDLDDAYWEVIDEEDRQLEMLHEPSATKSRGESIKAVEDSDKRMGGG
jgi:hypothetical protein